MSRGGDGSFAPVIAEAALRAVRRLRRAMRSSRDHFMTGQHSCLSDSSIRGLAAPQQRAETRSSDQLVSPRRDAGRSDRVLTLLQHFECIPSWLLAIGPGAIGE